MNTKKREKHLFRSLVTALAMGLTLGAGSVHAAVIAPIGFDFGTGPGQEDPTDSGSDFEITTEDEVNTTTLSDAFRFITTDGTQTYFNGLAAVDTNLSVGTNFSMTSDQVNTSGSRPHNRYGFTFFGDGETSLAAVFAPNQGSHGQLRITQGYDTGFGGMFDSFNRTSGTAGSGSEHSFHLEGVFLGNGD